MPPVSQEVVDKIRKCLALTKSNWEGEADTALLMAKRLMEQHGLTQAQVEMNDDQTHVLGFVESKTDPRCLWPWEKHLAIVVAALLPVRTFLQGYKNHAIVFVGTPSDAELARSTYLLIRQQLLSMSRDEATPYDRRSFLQGCVSGLLRRARELQARQEEPSASRALVVVKEADLKKHMEDKYRLKTSRDRGSSVGGAAYYRGRDAAANVRLGATREVTHG